VPGDLRLIACPFHMGVADVGMGAGSRALATDEPLLGALERQGWRTSVEVVERVDESRHEIARAFAVDRRLSERVQDAAGAGAFPFVLSGNCNSCLGTVAGLGPAGLGVVWFDAHADFDTPDDNLSGFFDVMALSTLTGDAWRALGETIPGFAPVDERDVVLAAVRDLEPYQRQRLERSAVRAVPGEVPAADLGEALDDLRRRVDRIYLHFDLDALDAGEGRANEYASPGGPSLAALEGCLDAVFDRFAVAGAALTAYDPAADSDGRAMSAARRVVERICERALPAA
jgi:arginase